MLTDKEIEALKVVIGTMGDCWYRDVLVSLLDRSKGSAIQGGVTLKRECGVLHKSNG